MSSSPTAATSTTVSSTSSPSPPEGSPRVTVIACGAIAQHCAEAAARHGWPVRVQPLPPLLHNRPERIAGEVAGLARALQLKGDRVVVGFADCGTYGSLDEVCTELRLPRLPGLHCYDLYAGAEGVRALFDDQPGTYLLTDFLVRSFGRTVVAELGLDRHPELRDDYFAHYTRVVWLAQHPTPELEQLAAAAAASLGLPLTTVPTGLVVIEHALAGLLGVPVPSPLGPPSVAV